MENSVLDMGLGGGDLNVYQVRKEQDLEVGFLKIYLSTH
jgi:hypothetical protein